MPVLHGIGGGGAAAGGGGGLAPNEMMRMQLRMLSPPPLEHVLQHLANIRSDTLFRWPLADLGVEAAYAKTYDFLWSRWGQMSESERNKVRALACVPVSDALVKPSRIFFRLASDLSPFMFEMPRHFGAHEPLLKAMGARETATDVDLAGFLRELAHECGGLALNPNELAAVIKVLETLTQTLDIATCSLDVSAVLVPEEGGALVPSGACFLCADRALLQRVDRNLVSLAHPGLSASVCAAVGIGQLRDAVEEKLEGEREPMFCHSEEEEALTRRVRSPELARALVSIVNKEEVRVGAVAAQLVHLSVLVARSLRTRLFLKPKSLHFLQGGWAGGADGGSSGDAMLDVTASEDGAEVLYFVDLQKKRIILSDSLPPGLDLCNVLAMALDQVLKCIHTYTYTYRNRYIYICVHIY